LFDDIDVAVVWRVKKSRCFAAYRVSKNDVEGFSGLTLGDSTISGSSIG
jgi:hypothetical protein